MNPEYNKERRAARAKALIHLHANDEHARHVDAAEYQQNTFAAVVIEASSGATRTAASMRTAGAGQAEEVAIALAIADADCHTVLSDSRQAVRNFAKGQICGVAERVLRAAKLQDRNVRIKWFLAHAGDASERNNNHDEAAHAAARALTNRAPTTDCPPWFGAKDRMTDYSEITKAYRLARRTNPAPHPRLS